jgi:hypothetical protein
MRRSAAMLVVALALGACADDDSGGAATTTSSTPSATTNVDGELVCHSSIDFEFRTALSSCDKVLEVGTAIVDPEGKATPDGAEILFVTLCTSIQQTDAPMTASRESIAQAEALIQSGACPGDASILSPSD